MADTLLHIDLHSHILPRADHGCKDSAESRIQLSMMRSVGTDIVVATPHFYPHIHNVYDFTKNVDAAVSRLVEIDIEKAPRLCVGSEVLLCENIDQLDGLSKLCIRGTNILLLELPTDRMNDGHFKTVEAVLQGGYTVVLAHIDRYMKEHPDYIFTLLDMGALAQINPYAMSAFGPRKDINNLLIQSKSIVAIGSDLHGSKRGALDDFVKLKKKLGEHYETICARSAELLKDAQIIDLV